MALNWVEELVGQLYQAKGYLVVYNVDMPMPKTPWRRISGHSDIDVLAISDSEVVHLECQSWWGPKKESEPNELRRLKERFDEAEKLIPTKYPFLVEQVIRNRFVTTGKPRRRGTDGPWNRLQDFCSEHRIELIEVNTILRELIVLLRERYPNSARVGKEPLLTRFLLHLIHNEFVKETAEQGGPPAALESMFLVEQG